MEEEKLQIAIYRINTENDLLFEAEDSFACLSERIKSKGFSSQNLQDDLIGDYDIGLFYKKSPLKPKWKDFFNGIAKDNQDILKLNQGWTESFVILFLNNISNNLYAITGGSGYHVIQEFIDDDFGVDILSCLITKEDKILKSVKEKSVMGGILGATKYFRKNYNLFENDGFGKIYQELKACLDKNILQDQFGFSAEDLKKESACIAKTSFKINKAITFNQIFQIIDRCEYILENPDNDPRLKPISINNVEKIVKKKKQRLIRELENELFNQLWKRYCDENENIDFDLCHKDFEKYLTASKYIVKKNISKNNLFDDFEFTDDKKLENIDELFKQIKELDGSPSDKDELESLIKSLKIYSYNDEDEINELTKGYVLHHIFGDVSFDGKKYFLIDNNWYKIKDDFIDELNQSCESFINSNHDDGLDKKWNYPTISENQYNESYLGENKTIVLDKITPDNIEPCDILKWDDENLYFYHVKAGFGNTMRDLCSQIFIAANKIKKDINSSKEYIGKIYDQLKNKKGSTDEYFDKIGKQTEIVSKDDFINFFTSKKLVFVLSVLDTATERNLKTDISEFNSNIAKFSLQELVKAMKGIDVEFRIIQIFKQTE
ncbi:TIGR04141 family sporadically distributed protein [Candidatus Parcubacteria bacterium]|nr:TIGR04141 family sporadically distributed protein [Candidatus Parcubacteria bacterium]